MFTLQFRSQKRHFNNNLDDANADDDEYSSINRFASELNALNNHYINNILFYITRFIIKKIIKVISCSECINRPYVA